ncbi:MAG: putative porin [Candidatus Omnitrophota bacterium]
MRHHPFTKLASILVVCLMVFSSAAFADEAQLMDMVKQMQKQMTELQTTVMAQKTEIQALKTGGGKIAMAPSGVEATPPMSEAEFNQRLSDSTGGANKWLKDLKFSGDLRLRYEAFHLNGNTAATTSEPNRNRFRIRLRYGFEKKFSDEVKVGFSMATGEKVINNGLNNDPISTNATLTNNFNFKNIWVEKAYATYTPEWAKMGLGEGIEISGLEVTAGKFNNPFEKGSTDMIWDRDLKPEGIYEKVDTKLLDTENFDLKAYGLLGQFLLMETGTTAGGTAIAPTGGKDASLFAYQVGLNPVFYVPGMERPVDALTALSVYSYNNYATNNNWQIGGSSQANGNPTDANGTRLSAQGFNILSIYQEVNFYPYGVPVKPFAEFAHNMSNQSGIGYVTGTTNGVSNQNYTMQGGADAWSLGLTLGKLQKKKDWQASYQYKYVGANSVPGAFNDSDFGGYNYGGSDKAGSVIKLGYNLTDYLTLNGACYLVRPITQRGGPGTNAVINGMQPDQSVRRFQLDMTYKF